MEGQEETLDEEGAEATSSATERPTMMAPQTFSAFLATAFVFTNSIQTKKGGG